jgi:hypothetical protein
MQAGTVTEIHPVVAKAARAWTDLAARHNIPVTIEPMEPVPGSTFGIGGAHIRIDTGRQMEAASIAIYPPTRKGVRAAQVAIVLGYDKFRGKLVFGAKPRITLRSMAFKMANFWARPEASA